MIMSRRVFAQEALDIILDDDDDDDDDNDDESGIESLGNLSGAEYKNNENVDSMSSLSSTSIRSVEYDLEEKFHAGKFADEEKNGNNRNDDDILACNFCEDDSNSGSCLMTTDMERHIYECIDSVIERICGAYISADGTEWNSKPYLTGRRQSVNVLRAAGGLSAYGRRHCTNTALYLADFHGQFSDRYNC
ncbi:hypothetical protein HELRODRAFT_169197 [Helobdella robusta]|uniref:Uncharacterized protein n=1 Tax=Helobdella robusta TaxID=6412 RepID=T1F1K1_HELRO|nr:hypothetical protein HELRODRAFT_169197 [Helobdella robusta]ESO08377.1 hypothetical protein HELRODRAFT_169197 [Helobdella robusta]